MSVRASVYSAAATTYIIAAIQLVSTVITTRLMTPAEIGVFAIALSLVLICSSVADWGVNIYIVQRHTTELSGLRSCAWVAWVGAFVVGTAVAAGSGPIAALYNAPEVQPLLLILSLRIFLYPCGVVSSSLIARDMRFKELSLMSISSATVQGLVSVVLVYYGARHMGLAVGHVAGFVAELVLSAYYVPEHFLLRPEPRNTRAIFRCGLPTMSVSVLNTLAANVSGLIIGYFLGSRDTGFFARATTLVGIAWRGVIAVINGVGIPAFAKANAEGADMTRTFLSATALLTGVVWPLFALVLLLSEPLVVLLFGRAWVGIVPVGQVLCVAYMITAMSVLSGALLLGLKRSGVLLRREVIAQGIVVACTVLGAQFSLFAVALAMVAASGLQLAVTFHLLAKEIRLVWTDALKENYKSLAALGATALGAGAVAWVTGSLHVVVQIIAGGAGGLACWLLAAWAVRHPLVNELRRIRSALARSPQS